MSRFILFIRSRTLLRFLILRTHVCLFVLLRLKKFCLLCLWILPLRHSLYSFLQRLLTELCFTLYPQRFLMFYVFQHFLSSAFQRISPGISSSILILFLAISSIFFFTYPIISVSTYSIIFKYAYSFSESLWFMSLVPLLCHLKHTLFDLIVPLIDASSLIRNCFSSTLQFWSESLSSFDFIILLKVTS